MTDDRRRSGDMDPDDVPPRGTSRRRLDRRLPRALRTLSGSRTRARPATSAAALPASAPEQAESFDDDLRATSSGSSSPASRTGIIPASSRTSRSPAARPACSPSSCRPRSTCRPCCGARRRRRPSSKRSRSAWLRQLIGLPDAFEGVIYDTASISTLHALAAAREVGCPGRADARPRRPHRSATRSASTAPSTRTRRSTRP